MSAVSYRVSVDIGDITHSFHFKTSLMAKEFQKENDIQQRSSMAQIVNYDSITTASKTFNIVTAKHLLKGLTTVQRRSLDQYYKQKEKDTDWSFVSLPDDTPAKKVKH